jgi:hypothetical protein
VHGRVRARRARRLAVLLEEAEALAAAEIHGDVYY